MRNYRVFARWQLTGTLEIEADSLQEAIQKTYDRSTPLLGGEASNDAFEVDEDITR